MSPEKTKELTDKYPDLYRPGFTFECGDGWFPLIHALSWCVSGGQVHEVFQIKEKYGGLRFGATPKTPEASAMIGLTERLSYRLCEICGAPGRPASRGGHWVKTVCATCATEQGFSHEK